MPRTIVYYARAVLIGILAGAMWSGNSFSQGVLIGTLALIIVDELRDLAPSLAPKPPKED